MQKQIFWKGLNYQTSENCFIKSIDSGTEIISNLSGRFKKITYKADYQIKINHNWQTEYFNITSEVCGAKNIFTYESDGKGNWTTDGISACEFKGCLDIDISLTPFTNSLPINRLKLNIHEEQIINVIYIDILEQTIKTMQQKYTKLSKFKYKYENIAGDFEATITVDEYGFVVIYPDLFIRTDTNEMSNVKRIVQE